MPDMRNILHCVICGRRLRPDREQVDTCGAGCYARLLVQQRQHNERIDTLDRLAAQQPAAERALINDAAEAGELFSADDLERWCTGPLS